VQGDQRIKKKETKREGLTGAKGEEILLTRTSHNDLKETAPEKKKKKERKPVDQEVGGKRTARRLAKTQPSHIPSGLTQKKI